MTLDEKNSKAMVPKLTEKIIWIPIFVIIGIVIISGLWLGMIVTFGSGSNVIYGIIIEGMASLTSVSVAVVIFRIQTLENRNQELEQSTLNFIYQISGYTFPCWMPRVEESIESGHIIERYCLNRINEAKSKDPKLKGSRLKVFEKKQIEKAKDQQDRLDWVLAYHRKTVQFLKKTKRRFKFSIPLLVSPIVIGLFMLIIPPIIPDWSTILLLPTTLISVIGIFFLINLVCKSLSSSDYQQCIKKTST